MSPMLDSRSDARLMASAIEQYADGVLDLDALRRTAESIIDRWQAVPEADRPPFSDLELPLWNSVWEIFLACREGLARDGVRVHLEYLSGRRQLVHSGARRP